KAVPLDKQPGDRLDGVGLRHACLRLLASRIAAFGDRTQGLAGEGAGGLEIERRVGAQRMLAGSAAAAIAYRPPAGAGRLHDQIQTRQVAVGDFSPSGTRLDGLDSADGEGAQHRVVLPRVTAG